MTFAALRHRGRDASHPIQRSSRIFLIAAIALMAPAAASADGWLGVTISQPRGVEIGEIIRDSPADQAGLQRGDILTQADGADVESVWSFTRLLASKEPGSEVALTVLRRGEELEIRVVLEDSHDHPTATTPFGATRNQSREGHWRHPGMGGREPGELGSMPHGAMPHWLGGIPPTVPEIDPPPPPPFADRFPQGGDPSAQASPDGVEPQADAAASPEHAAPQASAPHHGAPHHGYGHPGAPGQAMTSTPPQMHQPGRHGDNARRPWLGISMSQAMGGVAVEEVAPNSPAQAAGLLAGDLIAGVNGQAVITPRQLAEAVAALSPGDVAELSVNRQGVARSVQATLAQRPVEGP